MEKNNMNIYEKILKITEELGVVAKGLKVQVNKTASYNAVSERDVLDAVKPLEAKYGVCSMPIERKIVDSDVLVKESTYNGDVTKTNTLFMRAETKYRFLNVDNPDEYIDTIVYGDGLDTGDKAPGKAMTYADKYALMKMYKISTGDDPDKDASPEQGYTKKVVPITAKQIEMIEGLLSEEQIKKACDLVKKDKLEDFTIQEASSLISKIKGGEK